MKEKRNRLLMIHYSLLIVSVLLFTACGYKPTKATLHRFFGEKVYVQVDVDPVEPENAPFIKDAINTMIYQRFGSVVTEKKEAQSSITVRYNGSDFYPLSYDTNGYITRYRVSVRADFALHTPHGKAHKQIVSVDEADIQASALRSSGLRIEAIRKGMQKALDQFLAYAVMRGVLKN